MPTCNRLIGLISPAREGDIDPDGRRQPSDRPAHGAGGIAKIVDLSPERASKLLDLGWRRRGLRLRSPLHSGSAQVLLCYPLSYRAKAMM
jgi:hypothetical protein